MRRALAVCLIGLGLLGAAGCVPSSAGAPETPETPPAPPKVEAPGAWIPPYTPAQLALLAPVDHAVTARATRVLPDLARFAYAENRPLRDPDEAVKFTRMVATVLNDSPRFYAIAEADPGLENPLVQYGPPPET